MGEKNRVAIIVPGRRESVFSESYKNIGTMFERNSIRPIYIQPDWKLKSVANISMQTWKNIEIEISDNSYDEVYSFGFSLGALCTFLCSSKVKFKTSILCSMSFFREEIPYMDRLLKLFTKKIIYRREEPFGYPKVIPGQQFYFVYGEKELKRIPVEIIKSRARQFSSSETVIAGSAGHNIGHEGYQCALNSIIAGI